MARRASEYALYKGDTFIGIGTMKELVELSGYALDSLTKCRTTYYTSVRKDPHNRLYLINLDVEDDFYGVTEDDYGTNFSTT